MLLLLVCWSGLTLVIVGVEKGCISSTPASYFARMRARIFIECAVRPGRRRLSIGSTVFGTVPNLSSSSPNAQRVLDVAVAGLPNAGKSTLLNLMVGEKVSAVSSKRHTTRESMLGVMTVGGTQVSFLDTPGFVSHEDRAEYIADLSAAARESIEEVNLTLIVVDSAKRLDDRGRINLSALLEWSLRSCSQAVLVLNKVDLVNPKVRLLDKAEEIIGLMEDAQARIEVGHDAERNREDLSEDEMEGGEGGREDWGKQRKDLGDSVGSRGGLNVPVFMVSALGGSGVRDVADFLLRKAKPGKWIFQHDERTDLSKRERVSEIIRESLYSFLHKELPYEISQHTRQFSLKKNNVVYIEQDLRVDRASQRLIVLGKIRHIKRAVERDLTKFFRMPTHVRFNIRGPKRK